MLFIHPLLRTPYYDKILTEKKQLVQKLGLTDLCLFTEARYTRHLSQADLHSAFQNHPMAFEHFPSGSIVLPPVFIHRPDEIRATEISLGMLGRLGKMGRPRALRYHSKVAQYI
jgi:hypothetical protein